MSEPNTEPEAPNIVVVSPFGIRLDLNPFWTASRCFTRDSRVTRTYASPSGRLRTRMLVLELCEKAGDRAWFSAVGIVQSPSR